MKKIIFCTIVALALARAALAREYRAFTNQDGKSIQARIVQYDAKGERVQLELKNRKMAWVQLSDLSEADQGYIRQYNLKKANVASEKAKDKPEPVKELSEEELRAVGEQYVQAWNSGDIEKIKIFYLHPENVTQTKLDEHKKIIHELNVERVGGGYIVVKAKLEDRYWGIWLGLTADGKIKYTTNPLQQQRHPIQITLESMHVLYSRGDQCEQFRNPIYRYKKNAERTYDELKDMGMPMFGLDLSRARYQIDKSLIEMTEWLFEEGDKWDSTEPKVFFPTELLNKYKETGNYYH